VEKPVMASKYAEKFALPDGFATVLRDFTREVLRSQTKNINAFAYNYFMDLAKARGGLVGDLTPTAVLSKTTGLFAQGDPEGRGFLHHFDFKNVRFYFLKVLKFSLLSNLFLCFLLKSNRQIFSQVLAEYGLTDKDLIRLLSEADENDEGFIEYRGIYIICVHFVLHGALFGCVFNVCGARLFARGCGADSAAL
jgi:hypothetical protein